MKTTDQNKTAKGFTLIELLIVIAVLGVLAAVVLVAINPLEQLRRGRDSGRKNTVSQLASTVQAYYTSRNATYPPVVASWMSQLTTSQDLKALPAAIVGGTACVANTTSGVVHNGFCYDMATVGTQDEAIVWTTLEANLDNSGCTSPAVAAFMWSSAQSKTGVVCITNNASGAPTASSPPTIP